MTRLKYSHLNAKNLRVTVTIHKVHSRSDTKEMNEFFWKFQFNTKTSYTFSVCVRVILRLRRRIWRDFYVNDPAFATTYLSEICMC